MLDAVKQMIETAIAQQDVLLDEPIDISRGEKSPLYGVAGPIDSLALVSIIVNVEEQIQNRFGIKVCLADTNDLPQTATPFATLGSMRDYAVGRLSIALDSAGSTESATG